MAVSRRAQRVLWIAGAAIVLLALALIVLPPYAVRYATLKYLEDHGVSATLGNVDANIFTGRVVYRDAHGQTQAGDGFDIDRLRMNLAYRPLFAKQIKLTELVARGATVDVRRAADNALRVAGITVVAAPPRKQRGSTWKLGLARLRLDHFKLFYSQPAMHGNSAIKRRVTLDQSNARDAIVWRPDQSVPLDARMNFRGGRIRLTGSITPFGSRPKADLRLRTTNFALELAAPFAERGALKNLAGRVDSDLRLELRYSTDHGLDARADGQARWRDAHARIIGELDARSALYRWRGKVHAALLRPHGRARVTTDGALTVHDLDAEQPGGLQSSHARIRWRGHTGTRWDGAKLRAFANGRLDTKQTRLAVKPSFVFHARAAHWRGYAVLSLGSRRTERLQGRLTTAGARLDLPGRPNAVTAKQGGYSGFVRFTSDEAHPWLTLYAVPSARHAVLRQTRIGAAWGAADRFDADELAIEGLDAIRLTHGALSGLSLFRSADAEGQNHGAVVTADRATSDRVALRDGRRYQVGHLNVDGAAIDVERTKQGFGALTRFFGTSSQAKTNEKSATSSAKHSGPARAYIFEQLRVTGDRLVFADQTVSPAARLQGSNFALVVDHLNTASAATDANYRFSADVGDYGHVDSTGRVAPLSTAGLDMSIKAGLHSIALAPLSGYMHRILNRGIERGTADGDADIDARDGQLDGAIKASLSNFQLANGQSKTTEAALGVSLDTAISLIRNDNDVIKFSLPIHGNIASPDFSVGALVQQALFDGLRGAVTSIYSPFGLISNAAENMADLGSALSFQPISFQPGEHELSDAGKKTLRRVGTAMSKQSGLRITITGFAVPADADAMAFLGGGRISDDNRDELEKLAAARAHAVRDYLAARGIDTARLRVADPAIDDDGEQAKPRAKLALDRDAAARS